MQSNLLADIAERTIIHADAPVRRGIGTRRIGATIGIVALSVAVWYLAALIVWALV